jgi:hypothetical protein
MYCATISPQSDLFRTAEFASMETYTVVWSPARQAEFEKSQQRPAPPLPEARGKTGHTQLRADGGRRNEESIVDDLRDRWLAKA